MAMGSNPTQATFYSYFKEPFSDDYHIYIYIYIYIYIGASLALVGHPCNGGVTIKMPYGVDVLH